MDLNIIQIYYSLGIIFVFSAIISIGNDNI